MRRKITLVTLSIAALLFFVNACPPRGAGKSKAKKTITPEMPPGWPGPHYKFDKDNPLTQAGFELGRTLFYDRRLSRNGTISCGSCHQQFAAFCHLDHPVSHGIDNKMGKRNTPPLFNLVWQTSFFWDGSVNHIEVQPVSPMQNPVEMDESLANVISKLSTDTMYRRMYKAAFGDTAVNSQRTLKALAQFMGMMVSSNSKYDKYIRKEPGGEFTASELDGLQVFRDKCATCHKEPLFTDYSFRNNGLMPKYNGLDSGRATITRKQEDMYKFKVPSLRNLKYTWPYMHDGRFYELSQVIDHYTGSKFNSPTLDPAVQGIYLTPQQKTDLLAFLNTLNDSTFVKDPRFSDNSNAKEIVPDHTHSFQRK